MQGLDHSFSGRQRAVLLKGLEWENISAFL